MANTHHRDTENTEVAQRNPKQDISGRRDSDKCLSCLAFSGFDSVYT
jgi:hypothetical protein